MRAFLLYGALLAAALAAGAGAVGAALAPFAPAFDAETHAKAVKYSSMLIAAAALTAAARARGVTADGMGLAEGLRPFALGVAGMFALTALALLPLWLFLLAAGGRALAAAAAVSLDRLPAYLLVGLAVALIEEAYFRGLLLSQARRLRRWRAGAVVAAAAALYALLHLFDPQPVPMERWDAGLLLLAHSWPASAQAWTEAAAELALLLGIGALLGALRLRTNRLALCIGAHAAMVFSIKTFQHATVAGEHAPFWLGADPYGGYAAAIWIAALGALAHFAAPRACSKRTHGID